MRALLLALAALFATFALSSGIAIAHPGKLAVLTELERDVRHGSVWQVRNLRQTKVLGSETVACNSKATLCQVRFKLSQGSIRMTWYYVRRGRGTVLSRALINGGSGRYSGATGSASVQALGPNDKPSPLASGALLEVVFDFA